MAVAWLILLGVLTLFFGNVLDKRANPNLSPETSINAQGAREVVLRRSANGHYVAGGYINDQKVVFFLDTGATTIAIPERVANRLGLRKGYPIQVQTANGSVTSYTTQLERVRLGRIELNDVQANINPAMQGEEILLGMSFLKHLELLQRPQEHILILRQYGE